MVNGACVMIGYRTPDLLAETFRRLARSTPTPCESIDNTDSDIPLTTLWNQLMERTSAEVLVILNADVFVAPGWWEPLIAAFDSPDVAVAGPSGNQGPQSVDIGRATPNGNPDNDWLSEAAKSVREHHAGKIEDREVFGHCYAVRKSIWRALGGFDERIPLYGNETEYNRRCRHHRFRVVKVYASYVYHLGRAISAVCV